MTNSTSTKNNRPVDIAELLLDVEGELRQLGLWQKTPPAAAALASTEPFAVDTLTLAQWLQFVFLPTLHNRLRNSIAMPQRCGIAPMAEEYFRDSGPSTAKLIGALRQIDTLLSAGDSPALGAD